jgi:hypothetical protein
MAGQTFTAKIVDHCDIHCLFAEGGDAARAGAGKRALDQSGSLQELPAGPALCSGLVEHPQADRTGRKGR